MPDLDRLLNAIDRAEEHSYSSDQVGDLSSERARNIDNYLGRNTFPAPDGRSQVIDRSVYETIQWIKPSLARIFASGDDVVKLPPVGPEDEAGAKQESEYLNHVVLQKNNWFQIFNTACDDALITKTAYLHPYIEKRRQVETEKYENQTAESLTLIMQDKPEVVSLEEHPDEDAQPQPVVDPMTGQPAIGPDGQPLMQPPAMLYDIEIRRTKVEKHYCIMVLPPERVKVAQQTKTVQVAYECPYFEYFDFPTISDLRADGYTLDGKPIPDDIGADDEEVTLEESSRDQYFENGQRDEDAPVDPSMRRVRCRWVWIRYDYDEDGIAELQFVVVVGKQVLHREEVNCIPVAVLCPNPLPHRHIGLCPADDAADIQTISTVMLRQGLDNLQLSNNPQKFGDPSKVNLDDMMVSRPGGIFRTRNGAIFGQDFGVLQVPDIFPSVMNGLQFMEHMRQKRTGVNYSFQGLDANQLSQLQPGTVNQISSMAAQMVEQVARHIANGIEVLFSILHSLILKSGHKKESVKLRGEWVEVDPSTWRHRTDFRIAVGYSAGNKDAQIARLMGLANLQKEALMGGLPIVNARNVYETALELTKASDFATPERFWQDPATAPPPAPPQPDPTVMAMEQLKAQSADNVKRMDVEQKERDSIRDAEMDKYKADLDAQVKIALANAQAQYASENERFKAESAIKLKTMDATKGSDEIVGARTRANEMQAKAQNLEATLAKSVDELKQSTEAIQQALGVLVNARRVVKRGKNGKAESVDILTPDGELIASQKVMRDAKGDIMGTA